jgi:diacylglycerol kinase
MARIVDPRQRSWLQKFRCAARGIVWGVRAERNFVVHLSLAAAVVATAVLVRVSLLEWCVLAWCVAVVLSAELFNTAIERLARAFTSEHNDQVRDALDASSGAVLLSALGSATVGGLILGYRLGILLEWWSL